MSSDDCLFALGDRLLVSDSGFSFGDDCVRTSAVGISLALAVSTEFGPNWTGLLLKDGGTATKKVSWRVALQ